MEEYYGIYPAFVCNVKDPEKRGRIKVTCAEVFNDTETTSAWCVPVTPVGIENGGDFFIPEIDEGVFIMFIEGDIDRPVWIGGWWSKNSTPLGSDYVKPQEKRIINFKDNTILMKEGEFALEAGGVLVTLKKGKISIEGDIEIKGNIKLTGDMNVTGDAEVKGELKVSKDLIVSKDLNVTKNLAVNGDASISGNLTVNGTIIN